jgi:hypothetical protein
MFEKMKNVVAIVTSTVVIGATSIWLTASGWVINVESWDIANVNTAGGNFLSSSFEITKFLGTIAMIWGWFFVLNKLMALIPKWSGWK